MCLMTKYNFMIDYTDLKNGNIIAMINEYDETRIIIVDRVETIATGIHKLYTYAELALNNAPFEDDLFLEKDEPGYAYNVEDCVFRFAEEEEKIHLYNAIYNHFTREYNEDWYINFSQSTYYDIFHYLCDVFNLTFDDCLAYGFLYPDFIDDIHLYIWNMCCDVIGYPKVVDKKDVKPNEDKLISLNKAVKFLEDKLTCAEGTYASIEFLADIEYNSIREFIEDFKQKMED